MKLIFLYLLISSCILSTVKADESLFSPNFALFDSKAEATEKMRSRLKYLFGQSEQYEQFFYLLKSAIISGDASKIASLNEYPIRVNFKTGTRWYESQDEFIANFSKVVTPQLVETVRNQNFADLFANSNGVTIGNGVIWFNGYCIGDELEAACDKLRIGVTAYNLE